MARETEGHRQIGNERGKGQPSNPIFGNVAQLFRNGESDNQASGNEISGNEASGNVASGNEASATWHPETCNPAIASGSRNG